MGQTPTLGLRFPDATDVANIPLALQTLGADALAAIQANMGSTPFLNLRYPAASQAPNVPQDLQNLALDIESAILAAAGGGGGVIAETLLQSAATSIDLPGLDLSSWRQVRVMTQIRSVLGTDGNGNYTRAFLRLNDDAGANYLWAVQNDDGNGVNNGSPGYVNGIEAGHMPGPNMDASEWGFNVYDFILPGTVGAHKSVLIHGTYPYQTTTLSTIGSGIWKNTAAITKITIVGNDGGQILAGSRLVAIGIG